MSSSSKLTGRDKTALFAIVCAVVFCACWYIPWRSKTMTIKSMSWTRKIEEIRTDKSRRCTPAATNSQSTPVPENCVDVETETVVQSWPTQGTYPETPYWDPNARIAWSNKERRSGTYTIMFSDDGAMYNYTTIEPFGYSTYARLKPQERHQVRLNIFGSIIQVAD